MSSLSNSALTLHLHQMAVTTTVSEMAPRELRGISLSFFNMAMNIGGLAATLIPWGTNKHYGGDPTDDRAFRVPLYVALACPTISLVLELWLLPESPWWLMMKGHKDKARKALDYLYGCQPNYDSDRAVAELECVTSSIWLLTTESIVASHRRRN